MLLIINTKRRSLIVKQTGQMKVILCVCLLSISATGICQNVTYPVWLRDSLKRKGLDMKYELNAYMQEDLTGDGEPKIAALVIEKATHKKGILLVHNNSSEYYVFGAGTNFGEGSDDFAWAGKWYVYKKKSVPFLIHYPAGDTFYSLINLRMRYLLILLLFSLSQKELYSQRIPFSEEYDSVIYKKVQINGVFMSGTKKDILKQIGKPQKITRYVSDANDDH